ncbi:MAG: Alpha,alpha-trehalase [Ramlibacter sp.]|nr:Alpha,alpha-trehalase [Ramlibacter sp.]
MSEPQQDPHPRHAAAARAPPPDTCTPADRYQELFVAVQQGQVFADSKSFVDCAPRRPPRRILQDYRARCDRPGFDLKAFVHEAFDAPQPAESGFVPLPGQPLAERIEALWPFLTRQPESHPVHGSLLQLPHAYVVPGGRFAELYYWDSYFTMLGLPGTGSGSLVQAMTENFAWLVDTYGHVPNGTRTYYLSRSHPPVFTLMTQLCEQRGGAPAREYLPQLRREHAFWMAGEQRARPGCPVHRVVALDGGARLNRYWDARCTPREESWREDVATAARADRPPQEVYRHLRAAAESGWDFSSRWLEEDEDGRPSASLATIRTTDFLPVDLNCFLHELERHIAVLAEDAGDASLAHEFRARARQRAAAIQQLHWDPVQGCFVDYDWRRARPRRCLTAATLVPLFCGVATQGQASAVAQAVRARLLAPGGMGTTEFFSGEQWDRPNGWAPLQWMAAEGFARYGLTQLAQEIRHRWLTSVQTVYAREGKLVEKYALRPTPAEHATGGGGGEYPLQDGFGWTNGVTACWLATPN